MLQKNWVDKINDIISSIICIIFRNKLYFSNKNSSAECIENIPKMMPSGNKWSNFVLQSSLICAVQEHSSTVPLENIPIRNKVGGKSSYLFELYYPEKFWRFFFPWEVQEQECIGIRAALEKHSAVQKCPN